MQTGSLFNHLMGNSKQPTPEVGMAATELCWTDRHAGTIIEVSKNGKRVVWQEDFAVRTDSYGMSDAQSYSYSPNPNGRTKVFTLRKNGAWVTEGSALKSGNRLSLGHRDSYHDYSF